MLIHVKFREARKLMVLMCLIILYAQILSGFENMDIQDLFLNIFILFQLQSWIVFRARTTFSLKSFQTKKVVMIAMMKIISNCVAGMLNNYFLLNESSSLY